MDTTSVKDMIEKFKDKSLSSCKVVQRLASQKKLYIIGAVIVIILYQFSLHIRSFELKNLIESSILGSPTEDKECWQAFSILDRWKKNNVAMEGFIPSSFEEMPKDVAPAIPKTFLIEEENYCSKRPELRVIAYVHSAIISTKRRQDTRNTWGRASKTMGTVFMVGRVKSKEEEDIVREESSLYGDIVQGNYVDTYKLLIYKALNALHWVTKNCGSVPWVLHSDDDTIIDVSKLMSMLDELEKGENDNKIFCHIFRGARARRDDKWAVNYAQYPCDFYPPYCAGPCWFTSMKSANTMLNTVSKVKILWVDDVYLTGFVVERSGMQLEDAQMQPFHLKNSEIGSRIAWLNSEANRTSAWRNILKYYTNKV